MNKHPTKVEINDPMVRHKTNGLMVNWGTNSTFSASGDVARRVEGEQERQATPVPKEDSNGLSPLFGD